MLLLVVISKQLSQCLINKFNLISQFKLELEDFLLFRESIDNTILIRAIKNRIKR